MARIVMRFPRCEVQADVANVKEAVAAMAVYGEVFTEGTCGNCDSDDLEYSYRVSDQGHKFYSLRCKNCGHEPSFGQHKGEAQTLFAKRTRPDGTRDKRGWHHWKEDQQQTVKAEATVASSEPSPW